MRLCVSTCVCMCLCVCMDVPLPSSTRKTLIHGARRAISKGICHAAEATGETLMACPVASQLCRLQSGSRLAGVARVEDTRSRHSHHCPPYWCDVYVHHSTHGRVEVPAPRFNCKCRCGVVAGVCCACWERDASGFAMPS